MKAKITVVGVGNSGTETVNHMIDSSVTDEIATERLLHRVLKKVSLKYINTKDKI